jgi:3',5'-cyclic AMP phosphodiesterase CpdA
MRIAQISDIHAKPGEKSLEALRRALDWLAVARPDALIVSGDIADPPWDEGYPLVAAALADVACPLLMVPGNKDDRAGLRAAFPDLGWAAPEGPLNISRLVGEVRLVGLDVQVPGAVHGDAAPVLDWLGGELAGGGEPVLLFMHQHPFRTGFARVDGNMCRGADALADVIFAGSARVLLLSTGHGHRTVFTTFAGVPAMMCPSLARANVLEFGAAAAPLTDPPGFALHVIEEGRVMSQVISLG